MIHRFVTQLRGNPTLAGVVVLALFVIVFSAGLAASNQAERNLVYDLNHDADMYALGLRGAAEHYDYLPYAVSQQPDVVALLSGAPATAQVNRYLEELNRRAGSSELYVLNTSGKTLAASNWRSAQSFVGNNYHDRPYFIDAMAGGRGLFHGVGITTQIPGLFMSTPIRAGEKIIGVAVVKVDLDKVRQIWANSRDPVILTDKRGIVFLSSQPDWLYASTRELDAEDYAFIRRTSQYPEAERFERLQWKPDVVSDGSARRVSTVIKGEARSYLIREIEVPELDWKLTVLASYQPVLRAKNQVLTIAAMLGLVIGVLVLYSWNKELRKEREFRKAMEESLHVGMRARDMEGRIIYVNAALCEMLGFSQQELMGMLPPYPYWRTEEIDQHWRDNDAAMSGKAAKDGFESKVRTKQGKDVVTMVYTAPLKDAFGRQLGWMSSVLDITQQKLAEEKIREHQLQLQRASRIAHVGEIASSIAHELNQPLQALAGYATVATEMTAHEPDSGVAAIHQKIQLQVQRCAQIIQRIREIFRQQTPGLQSCDLSVLTASVIEFLRPEINKHKAQVVFIPDADLPIVQVDPIQIEQILVNLIVNALQAMKNVAIEQREVRVAIERLPEYLQVSVTDCGPGIDAALSEQLFTPYFTTKPEGLGLGLNICRTIVERHGGEIRFENLAGAGACFSFTIPLTISNLV